MFYTITIEPMRVANVSTAQIKKALKQCNQDLVKKFIRFHNDNKDVYELFYQNAKRVKETGRDTYSAWVIANMIRWQKDEVSAPDEEFKINNNFIGLYARVLMSQNKDLDGFFNLRKTKG